MRGLTVVVAGTDPVRLRSALGMAAAQAALGGASRLFLDRAAVGLLAPHHAFAGEVAELVETALALGVSVMLCQTGLAEAALDLGTLDPRLETGGITMILASLEGDRLVVL